MAKRGTQSGKVLLPGAVAHGGYALYKLLGRGEVSVRTWLGRLVQGMREDYALAYGYATWLSVPKPLQATIKQAVRLELFAERLFAPFWDGGEPPKRFDTISENLRRVLNDMGLEPQAAGLDVAAALAAMRKARGADQSQPASSSERS